MIKKEPLKVYVATKDGLPFIGITTNKHEKFTEESFEEVIKETLEYAKKVREDWNDNDWFPCGFVNLKVDSNSEIVKFIKKRGALDRNYYSYGAIQITKAYGTGYNLYIRLPFRDAITSQCMRYKQRVYEKFQELLAFLNVKSSVKTMID